MFWIDLIFAILVALLLVALFAAVFQVRGPWNSILWFFLVVLLVTWAGGVWLAPMGPAVGGFYFFPFLLAGLVVVLLLAATTTPPPKEGETVEFVDAKEQRAGRRAVGAALGIFFWVLLMLLAAVIFFRYIR
jgi:hypothetical protein